MLNGSSTFSPMRNAGAGMDGHTIRSTERNAFSKSADNISLARMARRSTPVIARGSAEVPEECGGALPSKPAVGSECRGHQVFIAAPPCSECRRSGRGSTGLGARDDVVDRDRPWRAGIETVVARRRPTETRAAPPEIRRYLGIEPFRSASCRNPTVFPEMPASGEPSVSDRVGERGRVQRVAARHDRIEARGVGDPPGDRTDLIERGSERDEPVARDAAVGGLQADDAAAGGRLANGASGVRSRAAGTIREETAATLPRRNRRECAQVPGMRVIW